MFCHWQASSMPTAEFAMPIQNLLALQRSKILAEPHGRRFAVHFRESCGSSYRFSCLSFFCSFWRHVVALRQGVWMPQVHGCPDRTDVLRRCYGSSTHASPLGPGQACGKHRRHADVYSYKIQQTLQMRK